MITARLSRTCLAAAIAVAATFAAAGSAHATTTKATLADDGTHANGQSFRPALSRDGRFLLFQTYATNLDPSGRRGLFVRDVAAGTNTWLDADSGVRPQISDDGRFVVFASSTRRVEGQADDGGYQHVFFLDRTTGGTEMIDVASDGGHPGSHHGQPAGVSADGRYVAFTSPSPRIVPEDTNNTLDVFVRDRVSGTTERVSVPAAGGYGNRETTGTDMTPDGRYVVMQSEASNLVAGDDNATSDVFVRDRESGTTELISVSNGGEIANQYSGQGTISADGQRVAFHSHGTNLSGAGDGAYVRDRAAQQTIRMDLTPSGAPASAREPRISRDGGAVVFHSRASNLVDGDTNDRSDVFVRDVDRGTVTRVSVSSTGVQSDADAEQVAVSDRAGTVAWISRASTLVEGDGDSCTERRYVHDPYNPDPNPTYEDVPANCTDIFLSDAGVLPTSVTNASGPVAAGGTVATNQTATADDPLGTAVTSPVAGQVSIAETTTTTAEPTSYSLFGYQVDIEAPAASTTDPLRLTFVLHSSLLPEGTDASTLQVFRNGEAIADCTGPAGTATPDPCVESRTVNGDQTELRILTSHASAWNFGARKPYAFTGFFSPLVNAPAFNSFAASARIPVGFALGGDQGMRIFASGYPRSQRVTCDTAASLGDDRRAEGRLTYDAETNRYNYVWKTDKAWAAAPGGPCRQLVVKLLDGTTKRVNIEFPR